MAKAACVVAFASASQCDWELGKVPRLIGCATRGPRPAPKPKMRSNALQPRPSCKPRTAHSALGDVVNAANSSSVMCCYRHTSPSLWYSRTLLYYIGIVLYGTTISKILFQFLTPKTTHNCNHRMMVTCSIVLYWYEEIFVDFGDRLGV